LSEKEMIGWLKFDEYRTIFEICVKEPKTAKEIEALSGLSPSDIAEKLQIMENHGILEFSQGKWKATETGTQVYRKFFG